MLDRHHPPIYSAHLNLLETASSGRRDIIDVHHGAAFNFQLHRLDAAVGNSGQCSRLCRLRANLRAELLRPGVIGRQQEYRAGGYSEHEAHTGLPWQWPIQPSLLWWGRR
jgi:hypothetical protein